MARYQERQAARKRDLIPTAPEIWRRIPGLRRYEASNLGCIRYSHKDRIRLVKIQTPESARYAQFTAFDPKHGERRTFRVHVCVCAAFNGKRPHRRALARHLDDNPRRNHAGNLEWGTYRQNHRDAQARGTVPGIGPALALEVRRLYEPTRGRITALRKQFGIGNKSLRQILHGTSYREISGGKPVAGYPVGGR